MPYMQAYVENANTALNRYNVKGFKSDALSPTTMAATSPNEVLSTSVNNLPNIVLTAAAKAYLDSWPVGLQEIVRAAVYSAAGRQLPVTFAWMPQYDFRITVTETAGTVDSLGGMTILLESPFPP